MNQEGLKLAKYSEKYIFSSPVNCEKTFFCGDSQFSMDEEKKWERKLLILKAFSQFFSVQ